MPSCRPRSRRLDTTRKGILFADVELSRQDELSHGVRRAFDAGGTHGDAILESSADPYGGFSTPISDAAKQRHLERNQIANIMGNKIIPFTAGTLDPVRATIGWLPDSLETGLIKAPGAVGPFMAITQR